MSPGRITPWLIGAVLAVLTAGALGWATGAGSADGKSDAQAARELGFKRGYSLVFGQTRKVTALRGLKAGAVRGRRAGAKTGAREGKVIGAGNAEIEQAVDSQKSAESAAAAAESEIAARAANCGILPAAPSWCPTGDELSSYKAAVAAAKKAAEEAEKEEEEQEQEEPGNGRP